MKCAKSLFLILGIACAIVLPVYAIKCIGLNNNNGSVDLPACPLHSSSPVKVLNGVNASIVIDNYANIVTIDDGQGGEFSNFQAIALLNLTGQGQFAGFNRSLQLQLQCVVHRNPRSPGDPVQSFDTEMLHLEGEILGDPDFDFITIRAGNDFGLPSPGHTTLTRQGQPGSNFDVESFFDISYQIDYKGAPGSMLDGLSGSTTGTIRMDTCPGPGPGDDCFKVVCGNTNFDFSSFPLPADFFEPGSEPFDGQIFMQGASGGLDTVIRRLDDMCLPDIGSTATVPIEIVSLNLVSCQPITVNSQGQPSQWDVKVSLAQIVIPFGILTATKTHANGGVFNAEFYVQPMFVFTRVGDPGQVVPLEPGLMGMPPILFQSTPYPWSAESSFGPNPPCDGNGFYPGPDPGPMDCPSQPQANQINGFLELQPPQLVSPFFALDTAEQWQKALDDKRITSFNPDDWADYMDQWEQYREPPTLPLYPDNSFLSSSLRVHQGDPDCLGDPFSIPGLVMELGTGDENAGPYSSAFVFEYPADPDLTNVTVTITVFPPCGVNAVSFGMMDTFGNIRAWYWLVATAPGPGPFPPGMIPCDMPTTINIDTSLLGPPAAIPAASSYMNSPGFDITQVIKLIVDENFLWVDSTIPPAPGTTVPRMWNYWYDLIISPNEQVKPSNPLKWTQPPKQIRPGLFYGWDEVSIYGVRPLIADDWECRDQRPISDVHWWGSFEDWTDTNPPMMPIGFHIGIWTDVPANPSYWLSRFSHPGSMVWEYFCYDYQWNFAGYDKDPRVIPPGSDPGTIVVDPTRGIMLPTVHDSCFQFYCDIPYDQWFYQTPTPTGINVYWLSISAIYPTDPTNPDPPPIEYPWGWKTRPKFFNGDAVRIYEAFNSAGGTGDFPPRVGSSWQTGEPIEYPMHISWDQAFELTTDREADDRLISDLNFDRIVNLLDWQIFTNQWLERLIRNR